MKLLAVNCSPRKKWNTASLLEKVAEGAALAGAEAELVHLIDFDFRGCVSCFKCKKLGDKSYSRCGVKDALTPVLQKAHAADVLVLGTPIYFWAESALYRAFFERMFFQYNIYTKLTPPAWPAKKGAGLVYTMNVSLDFMRSSGLESVVKTSQRILTRFCGSCDVLCVGETMQFDDYSKYESDNFDGPERVKRHAEVFPQELEAALAMGRRLVS